MRMILMVVGAALVSGCAEVESADQDCEQASHALRVHDSKIDASGAIGFTTTLRAHGTANYHCVTTSGNQIACSTIEAGVAKAQPGRAARLLRDRSLIENRVARACQI